MKKVMQILTASTALCLLLAGCTPGAGATPPPPPPPSAAGSVPTDTNSLLADSYLDVPSLPVVKIDVDAEYTFEDRSILLDDTVDNQMELLVYGSYYADISGDYEPQRETLGSEVMRSAADKAKEQFDQGLRMQQIQIHELTTLLPEDLLEATEYSKEYLLDLLREYQLYRYVIVRADLDWTYSQALSDYGPELDEGRYVRYFLVGNSRQQPQFQLYEMFWEDFLSAPDAL